jgi:hypothetical protein
MEELVRVESLVIRHIELCQNELPVVIKSICLQRTADETGHSAHALVLNANIVNASLEHSQPSSVRQVQARFCVLRVFLIRITNAVGLLAPGVAHDLLRW